MDFSRIKTAALAAVLVFGAACAKADVVLISEGFDSVSGLAAKGWVVNNQSAAGGSTSWFQGNAGPFDAQSGAANSYVAANFNNAPAGGAIADWLITPTFDISANGYISFFTRTDELLGLFSDRLDILFNASGSTNLSDFTRVAAVNESRAVDGYPAEWTEFKIFWSGTGAPSLGRFAFVYNVPNSNDANYIGLDSVSIVPEPSMLALAGLGLGLLALGRRRRTA